MDWLFEFVALQVAPFGLGFLVGFVAGVILTMLALLGIEGSS